MASRDLTGSLASFRLILILRLLQASRVTGRLQLQRGHECIDLFVEGGRTLYARTNVKALRLGDALVRRGQLPTEVVELALAFQEDQPGARLGRMLVDNGALTEAQMREAMLEVQRNIVLAALRWSKGTFRFGEEERIIGEDIRLELDVDEMVIWALNAVDWRPDGSGEEQAA